MKRRATFSIVVDYEINGDRVQTAEEFQIAFRQMMKDCMEDNLFIDDFCFRDKE